MRRGVVLGLVAISLLGSQVAGADGACIERHSVTIARGLDPNGETWSVEGTIENSRHCREWLFGVDFTLPGAGDWSWGTGIPAGGHLSFGSGIEASDDLLEDGSYRVFSGSASARATRIVATLSNGKKLVVRPALPSARLRRKVTWLRGVRYFVRYYPPTGFVVSASLFSASGQLLYRSIGLDGEFF